MLTMITKPDTDFSCSLCFCRRLAEMSNRKKWMYERISIFLMKLCQLTKQTQCTQFACLMNVLKSYRRDCYIEFTTYEKNLPTSYHIYYLKWKINSSLSQTHTLEYKKCRRSLNVRFPSFVFVISLFFWIKWWNDGTLGSRRCSIEISFQVITELLLHVKHSLFLNSKDDTQLRRVESV